MFLFPSKPKEVSNPAAFIETLKGLGKLQNWRVQIKKNGCRAESDIQDAVTIYNRQNSILTVSTEMDWSPLKSIFPKNSLLDGELIGRKQGETSNRLYLWDLPYVGSTDLMQVPYKERYDELFHLFTEAANGGIVSDPEWAWADFGKVVIGVAKMYPAEDWEKLLDAVKFEGSTGCNEGLVFKDITNSLGWDRWKTRDIKEQVKFLLKYRH
jgi:hypothetical protein